MSWFESLLDRRAKGLVLSRHPETQVGDWVTDTSPTHDDPRWTFRRYQKSTVTVEYVLLSEILRPLLERT